MYPRFTFRLTKWILLFAPALLPSVYAETASVAISGTRFEIPAPEGFSPVTSQMSNLNKLLDALVPPVNMPLAAFIPDTDVESALQNKVPDMIRYFSVQTSRNTTSVTVTKTDFGTVKDAIRKQNDQVIKEIEKQVPGLVDKINKNVAKSFEADLGLKSINMVPFAPHQETDRSLAFSMLVNYAAAGPAGTAEAHIAAVTGTLVHLRGKILYLYANGGEKDLEWTRQVSRDWAAAVIAANPSDAATSAQESNPRRRGFDWSRVVRGTIIGAVCGALFGLFQYLRKKRNSE